jgi:RNA polymerase sigma-70 factor (ECF subfamily)
VSRDVEEPALEISDRSLLDRLSRRHAQALKRYFGRRGLRHEDAEDAVQDVFARLLRRAGTSRIERIDGYLFETAASVAVDFFRRGSVRQNQRHDIFDDLLHSPETVSTESAYVAREELGRLSIALRELPERTRNALLLSRLEGLTHAEIALRLGVSVSSVEKHVIRAVAHLTRRLGRGRP